VAHGLHVHFNNMFNQQQNNNNMKEWDFNFQVEDELLMEWDFITVENIKNIEKEEQYAKIIVQMNQETKMINLPKSTLNMEYRLSDLRKEIKQEFKLSNDTVLKIFFDKKRFLVTNDTMFKQILEFLGDKAMEIEVTTTENKHCILCMKSNCFHTSNVSQNAEKKRKIDCQPEINILEPVMTSQHPRDHRSTISLCSKKRRISSCSKSLKSSQNLLIPQIKGSFIL